MATIEKRGAKQWRAKIRRGGYPAQSATFNTRKDAEAWARQIEWAMDRGAWQDDTESRSTTLHEALCRYEREVTSEKRGASQERYRISVWKRHPLSARPLSRIRGVDLASYRDARIKAGAGPNTVRLELALLSHLYTVAISDWGMEDLKNPVKNVRKPKPPAGRDRRLMPGEAGTLLAWLPKPHDALFCFAVETAMRRGEIVNMRWENVDLKRRVVYLPDTKNGEPRTVPLSVPAVKILRSLPRRLDGSVWGLSGQAITDMFRRVCALTGITDLHFHDLRHEAVSRLIEGGLPVMTAAAISGHKTLQMLKRYTHLRAADLVRGLDEMKTRHGSQ